ncbi:MAG: GNAT family N-acetyltransferase [Steroidobacteraceae bacterium]
MGNDEFRFELLTENDLPSLTEWLGRPHVAEHWGSPPAIAKVREKYISRLRPNSAVTPYVAWLGDRPVGYIQSYVAARCGNGWWADVADTGVVGIDQFLADEESLGQGLGSALVAAFVQKLFADPTVGRVQTDPSPANKRAIRCYEKAGFREVGLVDTPAGEALLMVVERPESC